MCMSTLENNICGKLKGATILLEFGALFFYSYSHPVLLLLFFIYIFITSTLFPITENWRGTVYVTHLVSVYFSNYICFHFHFATFCDGVITLFMCIDTNEGGKSSYGNIQGIHQSDGQNCEFSLREMGTLGRKFGVEQFKLKENTKYL